MTRFGPEADLCLAAVRACSSCSIDILSVSLKGYPYSRGSEKFFSACFLCILKSCSRLHFASTGDHASYPLPLTHTQTPPSPHPHFGQKLQLKDAVWRRRQHRVWSRGPRHGDASQHARLLQVFSLPDHTQLMEEDLPRDWQLAFPFSRGLCAFASLPSFRAVLFPYII